MKCFKSSATGFLAITASAYQLPLETKRNVWVQTFEHLKALWNKHINCPNHLCFRKQPVIPQDSLQCKQKTTGLISLQINHWLNCTLTTFTLSQILYLDNSYFHCKSSRGETKCCVSTCVKWLKQVWRYDNSCFPSIGLVINNVFLTENLQMLTNMVPCSRCSKSEKADLCNKLYYRHYVTNKSAEYCIN